MFHQGLPWLSSGSDSVLPLQGVQVQTLVQELRFRVTFSVAKKKKKGTKIPHDMQCGNKKKKKKFFGKKTQRNGSLGIKEDSQRRFTEPGKAFWQLEITASGFRLTGWEDVLMKWLFKAQAFLLTAPHSCFLPY